MNSLYYPRLIKRIRAILIDSVLIPVVAIGSLITGESMGISSTAGKLLLIALPVFILEPVMISMTGGTIGHHIRGIKVTKENGETRLNIAAATVRFIVKLFFGWFSLISVLTTKKHQALHDVVARSVVVHRDASRLSQYDILQERKSEEDGFVYPSAARRAAVIIVYCFLILVLLSILVGVVLSDDCLELDRCTAFEKVTETAVNFSFLVLLGATIVAGWRSQLYGCRRRKPPYLQK